MTRLACFPLDPGPLDPSPDVVAGWRITSTFGNRPNPMTGAPSHHGGMDLAFGACFGQPIYAPCDGYVTQSWDPSGGGNWTSLVAPDGSYFGFGHASSFVPGASGRQVTAGEVLAYVGSTGASTGAHLHIAYKAPGASAYSDPWDLLQDAAAGHRWPRASTHQPITTQDDDMALSDDDKKYLTETVVDNLVTAFTDLKKVLLSDLINMAKIVHHDLSTGLVAAGQPPLPPFTVNIDD